MLRNETQVSAVCRNVFDVEMSKSLLAKDGQVRQAEHFFEGRTFDSVKIFVYVDPEDELEERGQVTIA